MKNCKSSETRFAKVSRRSELCSRGKRPFEILKKNRNSRVGVKFAENWQREMINFWRGVLPRKVCDVASFVV